MVAIQVRIVMVGEKAVKVALLLDGVALSIITVVTVLTILLINMVVVVAELLVIMAMAMVKRLIQINKMVDQ